ncbi:hypothetical protein BSKO_09707 [Bryopsis sp. KO-2023]|nr:hypothetical protein BSKO_09707 [Bryopsis sp. KO-2023]
MLLRSTAGSILKKVWVATVVLFFVDFPFVLTSVATCRPDADITIVLLAVILQGIALVTLHGVVSSDLHTVKKTMADFFVVVAILQLLSSHHEFKWPLIKRSQSWEDWENRRDSCVVAAVGAGVSNLLMVLFDLLVIVLLGVPEGTVTGAVKLIHAWFQRRSGGIRSAQT